MAMTREEAVWHALAHARIETDETDEARVVIRMTLDVDELRNLMPELEAGGARAARLLRTTLAHTTEAMIMLPRTHLLTDLGELAEMFSRSLQEVAESLQKTPAETHLTFEEGNALREAGANLEPFTGRDPAARTHARYLALVAKALTVEEAAAMLGVKDSRIRQRLGDRTLIGWKLGREWRLPQFQFIDNRTVLSLEQVAPRLPEDLHPVAVWRWFTTPSVDLVVDGEPVTPITWLEAGGDARQAIALAEAL